MISRISYLEREIFDLKEMNSRGGSKQGEYYTDGGRTSNGTTSAMTNKSNVDFNSTAIAINNGGKFDYGRKSGSKNTRISKA